MTAHQIQLLDLLVLVGKQWVLVGSFAIFLLLELYSLFSGENNQTERQMFWFDPTPISFQTWIDYAATRTAICVSFFILRETNSELYRELNIYFWLSFGYLIDYFVIYNNPIAKIYVLGLSIPISYTIFMLLIAGLIMVKSLFTRKWT
jgi:hypothetical protein